MSSMTRTSKTQPATWLSNKCVVCLWSIATSAWSGSSRSPMSPTANGATALPVVRCTASRNRAASTHRHRPRAISSSRASGFDQALIVEQVELGCGLVEAGQDHMCLAAMMGLVIEPVVEGGHQRLNELVRRRDAAIADDAFQGSFVETCDPGHDALVLRLARGAEAGKILVQDGIEALRRLALAGETLHPDAIGRQQMVERAVHGLEERAPVGAILGVGESGRSLVEPLVGPGVVAGEARIMVLHVAIVRALGATSRLIDPVNPLSLSEAVATPILAPSQERMP